MSADTQKKLAGLDGSVSRAVSLLADARLPLIAGLGADVDGVRAALRLAQQVGGALDHVSNAHIAVELRVASEAGAMTTTVAEAVNRADLIVVAGPGARAFVEDRKLFAKASTPYGWRGKRSVLALGCEAPTTVSECETTRAIAGDPLDLLRELKAEVGNKPSAATHQTAVQMLKDARFGVVVVDPNDFDRFGFELMMALVKELNETTRFTSISVPAAAHGRGANLVSLWTTGGRLRVGFGRGYPEQDDWRFDAERLAESGEADLLIWVGALAPDLPAYASKLTTIALVPPGTKATADVVIEVGVPGVHHAGSLTDAIRDGFSFVEAIEADVHPTVADVLDAFSAALATRKGAA